LALAISINLSKAGQFSAWFLPAGAKPVELKVAHYEGFAHLEQPQSIRGEVQVDPSTLDKREEPYRLRLG